MNKRTFSFLMMCLLMTGTVLAGTVSESQARKIAAEFLTHKAMPTTGLQVVKKADRLNAGSDKAAFYVFNASRGYVIVAGDRTGGGGGMPFNAELPCGWGVRFSACPQYDAQGEVVEHGISPDVFCSLDDEKAKEGKDSMIETALSLIE